MEREGRTTKIRVDRLLVELGFCPSRERAQALILSGNVLIGETVADKAGALVPPDAPVRLRGETQPYVSRGGIKLKGALTSFRLDVRGRVCLDVGASTGGFTDCLLQEGAAKVIALDVGYGQLAWKLRQDARVVSVERTNIRYADSSLIPDPVDLAVIDVSFISLKLVIPAVLSFVRGGGSIVALIKPQFEVGRAEVGKHGVVRDPELHRACVSGLVDFCRGEGLDVEGTCPSPLLGPAGNKEFFLYAGKSLPVKAIPR
jgi:23S rRNA (cytidine1920-2'-O)/16S rRNA (cytidine1409-2'-O)-methyltransferase